MTASVASFERAIDRDPGWAPAHAELAKSFLLMATFGVRRSADVASVCKEAAARAHIEASGWMRTHLTKAVGLHVADEVGESIERHLFADASGRRHGAPRVGSWWDFTRIPGRARSHTKASSVWETWRLVGSLDGHLARYRHPQLAAAVSTGAAAAAQPAGTSILAQPSRLPAPAKPAAGSWLRAKMTCSRR